MIDEKATFKKFGYYSSDLKPQSSKRIIAVCDECGKVREVYKCHYRALCKSCCRRSEKHPLYGKHHSKAARKKISEASSGEKHPFYGKHHSEASLKKLSEAHKGKKLTEAHKKKIGEAQRGKKNPNWKGGKRNPYCEKWNEHFREYIRNKYDRKCFLCSKTEKDNGKRLSVHHVNGNKNCGCDEDTTCQFVPLCVSCHSKAHNQKSGEQALLSDKQKQDLRGWYI